MEKVKLNKPNNAKERGLLKGAIRRVFSRSELRRKVLAYSIIEGYHDIKRPRVTRWSKCEKCGGWEATYLMQVDHVLPVIPVNRSLEEMTWDELIDNQWCDETNLSVLCKPCHQVKTKLENKERRRIKREKR